MKGKFYVFEGIDGSGTTSVSKLVMEKLKGRGISVVWTMEPSEGPVGRLIRQVLTHQLCVTPQQMLSLFVSDRLDHAIKVIIPGLTSFQVVLCDRYAYSTYVYQLDALESKELLTGGFLKGFLAPSRVWLLDCEPGVALERKSGDPELFETYIVQQRIRDRYLAWAEDDAGWRLGGEIVSVLDSQSNSVEQLADIIEKEIVGDLEDSS